MTDYNSYKMSIKERIFHTVKFIPLIYFTGYIFYSNHVLAGACCLLSLLGPKNAQKNFIANRKNMLNIQFRDLLYAMQSSLSVGISVESAFREMERELAIIYPPSGAYILDEVRYISRLISMNEPVESIFDSFAVRSGIEDIQNFSMVLKICKRSGGNLVEAIRRSSTIISDKIDVLQEIDVLMSGKKLEAKILCVVPVVILTILYFTAYDFIEPLYTTLIGRAAMTLCAAMIVLAKVITDRIVDIGIKRSSKK